MARNHHREGNVSFIYKGELFLLPAMASYPEGDQQIEALVWLVQMVL